MKPGFTEMKTPPSFAIEHDVATVCPLDCPDSCSLDVTVQDGRVAAIDGSSLNPVTGGYICAKVRRFPERLYGPDRLLYPAVRKGPKGLASFERVSWDEALSLVAERMLETRRQWGGESILPYSYGGSNGLLTQDNLDAQLWRRFGTSRLARTLCPDLPVHASTQMTIHNTPGVRMLQELGFQRAVLARELAIDVCVGGWIAGFAVTCAVRGQCVGHRIIPKRLNATSLAQRLKSSPESACRLESQFGLFQLCGRGQAPMRNVE
jgi:anaerobic selenocysteine-containing dehydrogenase